MTLVERQHGHEGLGMGILFSILYQQHIIVLGINDSCNCTSQESPVFFAGMKNVSTPPASLISPMWHQVLVRSLERSLTDVDVSNYAVVLANT